MNHNFINNNDHFPLNSMPPVFSRHETFHPRYLWLKKGFDKAVEDNEIFNSEDATTILGVGKNMVKAIRYWSHAYKMLDETKQSGNKSRQYRPSRLGNLLLDAHGWDPYLEDTSSLWLLHWNLLKLPCYATTWYFTFNVFNKNIFTSDDLLNALSDYIVRFYPTYNISESSLIKDIHCLLRMYVGHTNQKVLKEDSIDSPFSDLGLIKNYGDTRHFIMNNGIKNGLAAEMVVAACLEFAAMISESAKTISISRLLFEPGSPGLCFKLNESLLCDSIEKVSRDFRHISLSETAGLIQFSFTDNPVALAEKILNRYYIQRRN